MSNTTKFWYSTEGGGRHWLEVAGTFDLTDDFDAKVLADDAAMDYHCNHDGWESSWPLTFALAATEDGPEVARFDIDRDVAPVFHATKAKVPA